MRYGIISDIHGNLEALRAVVACLQGAGVDAYVCVGDLVGYGPLPNECVELVAGLGAICVAGNHELIALGRLGDDRSSPLARESLRWTRGVLRADVRAYLARLPVRAEIDGLVLTHAALSGPERYVTRPKQADEELRILAAEYPEATILVLGHTHSAWAYTHGLGSLPISRHRPVDLEPGGLHLVNPGSVGQSRERLVRARCMMLDLKQRQATFYAVLYDVERCRKQLVQQGLPGDSYHLPPAPLLRRGTRRLRRLVRRVLANATDRAGVDPALSSLFGK
jgi:predicted phosphodiesterase